MWHSHRRGMLLLRRRGMHFAGEAEDVPAAGVVRQPDHKGAGIVQQMAERPAVVTERSIIRHRGGPPAERIRKISRKPSCLSPVRAKSRDLLESMTLTWDQV